MNIKNEDPFLANESYEKMLPPMIPISYQNVDSVPDSNSNYLAEHSPELLDLDDMKPDILHDFIHSSNSTDHYNTEFQILDCPTNFDYNYFPLQNTIIPTQKPETFYAIKDYLKRTSSSTEQYSTKFNSDSNDSLSSVSISPPPLTESKTSFNHTETKITRHKQNIHLWQFLKELLREADKHNNCIRWLSNKDGIFKIEDSAHVAKLWGQRKNRPAMNYDKLSRSLRQYYKKGIIKKTIASKRLVYQFGACYL